MKLIAVVEDSPEIRLLLNVVLSRSYEVVEYSDGEEALEGFVLRPPDLVILDISLPRLEGPEVLARMKANPVLARIPVVAFTAYASELERRSLLSLGFDEHISKPITDFNLLTGTVERLLQRDG
jgi:two-component system, OmpR family, alkaline phosphatase synthesis response regulator PhoP